MSSQELPNPLLHQLGIDPASQFAVKEAAKEWRQECFIAKQRRKFERKNRQTQLARKRSEPSQRSGEPKSRKVRGEVAHPIASSDSKRAMGADNVELGERLLAQLLDSLPAPGIRGSREVDQRAMLAFLRGIGPKDPLEALLALEIAACHFVGMECLVIGRPPCYHVEIAERNLNSGLKLFRTIPALLDALHRHRGTVIEQDRVSGRCNPPVRQLGSDDPNSPRGVSQ
jgi:hypothetical protein